MLGIAVVTYKRHKVLKKTLAALNEHTQTPCSMVIAEDGGGDGTARWCRREGYTVVTGKNRGVSWNKNRGLFALAASGCDPILLLEDDCFPIAHGWELDWIRATELWGHVSFAHKRIWMRAFDGDGSPENPYLTLRSSAQCSSVSSEALDEVGYLDTRFTGCGIEHKEWTSRLIRAGYGVKQIAAPQGVNVKDTIVPEGTSLAGKVHILGGLMAKDPKSHRDDASVERNRAVFRSLKREPLFRRPWSNDEEKSVFLEELRSAGIDPEALADKLEESRNSESESRGRATEFVEEA